MRSRTHLPYSATALTLVLAAVALHIFVSATPDSAIESLAPIDLEVYKRAAIHVTETGNLYDTDDYVLGLPFTYPPFAGWVFTHIFAVIGTEIWATIVWQSVSLLCLVGVIAACLLHWFLPSWRVAVATAGLAGASLVLSCVHENFYFGQINTLLMALIFLDHTPTAKRLFSGGGTGIAAGVKLTPGIFGILFLLQRQWRAAAVCALTGLATVGIGYLTINDAHDFWTRAVKDSSRIGKHVDPAAQSLKSVLIRHDHESWWIPLALLTVALVTLAAWLVLRLGHQVLAVSLMGLCACLVSPFTWTHHWVWMVPACVSLMSWGIAEIQDRLTLLPDRVRYTAGELTGLVVTTAVALGTYPQWSQRFVQGTNPWLNRMDPTTWGSVSYIGLGYLVILITAATAGTIVLNSHREHKELQHAA